MHKSFLRRAANRVLHLIAQFAPGCTTLRPFLHKLRGVKIHGTVFIGDQVYLENEYPEMVEMYDGASIALRSSIIAHNKGAGKIIIEKDAYIAANCGVYAPAGRTLIIGEGSVVAASSVVTQDIPPFTFVGGSPAKPIAKITMPLSYKSNLTYEDFKKGLLPL